jgi:hypothetical protein
MSRESLDRWNIGVLAASDPDIGLRDKSMLFR